MRLVPQEWGYYQSTHIWMHGWKQQEKGRVKGSRPRWHIRSTKVRGLDGLQRLRKVVASGQKATSCTTTRSRSYMWHIYKLAWDQRSRYGSSSLCDGVCWSHTQRNLQLFDLIGKKCLQTRCGQHCVGTPDENDDASSAIEMGKCSVESEGSVVSADEMVKLCDISDDEAHAELVCSAGFSELTG